MQKYLFLLLLFVCNAYNSWSQDTAASERFLITGQVPALSDGTVIGLYQSDGRLIVPIVLDTVADGRFTFSDTTSCVKPLMLLSSDEGFPSHWLDVWVAPGRQITITGEDRLLPLWRVESDIAEQQEQNGFQDCVRELNREYLGYNVAECGWFRQMQLEHDGDEEFARLAWAKVDSLRKYSFPLMRAIYKKELDYMITAPVGKVYMQKLVSYAQMTVAKAFMPYSDEVKALYAGLPEAMKHTSEAELAYQHLYPTAAVEVGCMTFRVATTTLQNSRGGIFCSTSGAPDVVPALSPSPKWRRQRRSTKIHCLSSASASTLKRNGKHLWRRSR